MPRLAPALTFALPLLCLTPGHASADELARVLAEAAAMGLIEPDTMLVNVASNSSLEPLDGSILTGATGGLSGWSSIDPVTTGQLRASVVGAMNTANIEFEAKATQGVFLNAAQDQVPVRAVVALTSDGPEVMAGGSLATSAIGSMNIGGVTVVIGE